MCVMYSRIMMTRRMKRKKFTQVDDICNVITINIYDRKKLINEEGCNGKLRTLACRYPSIHLRS